MTSVVWTCDTFENNLVIKHTITKYLKESCRYISNEHLSFKYFPETAFVREISANKTNDFGPYTHKWVKYVSLRFLQDSADKLGQEDFSGECLTIQSSSAMGKIFLGSL